MDIRHAYDDLRPTRCGHAWRRPMFGCAGCIESQLSVASANTDRPVRERVRLRHRLALIVAEIRERWTGGQRRAA